MHLRGQEETNYIEMHDMTLSKYLHLKLPFNEEIKPSYSNCGLSDQEQGQLKKGIVDSGKCTKEG